MLAGTAKLFVRGYLRDLSQGGDLPGHHLIQGRAGPQLVIAAFAPTPGGAVVLDGAGLVEASVHLDHIRELGLDRGELRGGRGAVAQPAV